MKAPLISVIIPVYKVEQYLEQCVNSVISQSYHNLEIFLVDDGSPDSCPALCDSYAKRDSRIQVIHKTNGGPSSSRNAAMDICTGELISFVDSDDWISPGLYTKVVEEFENQDLSCVYFEANIVDEAGNKIEERFHLFDDRTVLPSRAAERLLLTDEMGSQVWKAVYRKECWQDLRFPIGRNYEDLAVTYRAFSNTERPVMFLNDKFYNYRMNSAGISFSGSAKNAYHIFLAFKEHYDESRSWERRVQDICLRKATESAASVYNIAMLTSNDGTGEKVLWAAEARHFLRGNQRAILACSGILKKKKIQAIAVSFFEKLYVTLYLWIRKGMKEKWDGK